ncbi:MAG TPA: sugar phosphate isomerase/epimerase, partial [Opitutaceae bacterium]|nr:sugar phosphate isomerase/epimerase [Opitutaceae bacterium]
GYWHDTGHAEIKRRLGVSDPDEQLRNHADRLLGFHLHDVDAAGNDHRALGEGNIDFEKVSSFWKRDHVLVLELSPDVDVDAVRHSKREIEALVAAR